MAGHRLSALLGSLLVLPLGLLWSIVMLGVEPSALATGQGDATALGLILALVALVLLFPALAVSVWPMVRAGTDGKRRIYAVNVVVAVAVLGVIALTWGALAEEIVRCEVMRVPNCD
jgi:hypothetical protein